MAQLNRFSLVSLLALGMAMPAFAQVTPAEPADQPPAEEADQGRDVVVVTANKREETVQDVAVAVTAVTSEMRDELGISTITDLTNLTPGLSYTSANERVTLRGVGRNTNNFGAEPGVANYTDGIYQSFASIAGRDNLFIDRIEVLRGPQGTLYGRNSIGGALNIISKRPTDDFEGEFRLGAGNYDQAKVGLSLSGPLVEDWLRGRVVAVKEVRDEGFYVNRGTGETEGYNINNWNAEVQLEGDVGDRFHWWTKYTTGRYTMAGPPGGRTGAGSAAPYNRNFAAGGVMPQAGWVFSGNTSIIGYAQDGTLQENPRFLNPGSTDLNDSHARYADLDSYDDFALEMVYETGPFDIKYVGGYIYYNYNLYGDQDGTPAKSATYNAYNLFVPNANPAVFNACFPGVTAANPTPGVPTAAQISARTGFAGFPTSTIPLACGGAGTSTGVRTSNFDNTLDSYHENRAFFSNEVNFISTIDGPLQWIAGLYAYQENFEQPITTRLPNEPTASAMLNLITGLPMANPNRVLTYTNNIGLNNAYGAYAQFDYQFTDELKATLGARYSIDNKHIDEEAMLNCFIICNAPTAFGGFGPLPASLIANITPFVWNGVAPAGFTGPQPGVSTATTTNPTGVTFNNTTGISSRTLEAEWSAVTGTAGLEWTPTNDTLVFGRYSRGYKTGAFNASSLAPLPKTNPEFVDAYELGWKQEIPEWDLTANMALFLYDYKDIQTPLTEVLNQGTVGETQLTALRNVPKVQTTGFELESVWRPVDDLTLRFTYAYLKPEVKESGVYLNSLIPRNITNTADPAYVNPLQSVEGNVLPQSPENKVAFNASYMFNFEDGSSLLPSLSYYWRDGFASDIFNNPTEITPAFDQTDFRLLWNDADGYFTVIGFVRNAFDEVGYDSVSSTLRTNPTVGSAGCVTGVTCFNPAQPVSATNVPGAYYQNFTQTQPRTWGVELQVHF